MTPLVLVIVGLKTIIDNVPISINVKLVVGIVLFLLGMFGFGFAR